MNNTNKLVKASIFLALGVLFPIVFHMFKLGGKMFLPMHIPVLLAGVYLNPILGLIVGALTPLLSSVLTGMPILFPIGFIMMFELAAYGFFMSLFFNKFKMDKYISLIITLIIGRAVAGLAVYVLVLNTQIQLKPLAYVKGSIVTGLPGIVIQLILIPVLIIYLRKSQKSF
ncbi:MAG: ECF transporter S component [Bacillota bacterium]